VFSHVQLFPQLLETAKVEQDSKVSTVRVEARGKACDSADVEYVSFEIPVFGLPPPISDPASPLNVLSARYIR